MKTKYKIIFIITFLLLLLSISLSFVNYMITLKSTQDHLKNASLPLSTDNIYNEIQTHLIEPNLVASMMAQDTFLKAWFINEEEDEEEIKIYLESIKNRYKMSTVFLASENTQNYYLSRGFVEKMKEDNPTNAWYYRFKKGTAEHEVNIDYNINIDNSMFMFINHKIFNEKFHMLGATGVGLKVSYIDEMLKRFRKDYKFNVFFVNKKGDVVLFERGVNRIKSLKENDKLYEHQDKLISHRGYTLKYSDNSGEDYLVHSKYVPELNLYLLVQARVSDFTTEVLRTSYINLIVSLLVTLLIIFIIIQMIQRHNIKLEILANNDELTGLPNRRVFDENLKHLLLLNRRKNVDASVLFFDIDNFKNVNDSFGHNVGDRVLIQIAQIIKDNIRESDLYARWGGEEFIITFVNSSLDDSKEIAEKLRFTIEENRELQSFVNYKVTASFGLTQITEKDSLGSILRRVDNAMYEAKESGKNRVIIG